MGWKAKFPPLMVLWWSSQNSFSRCPLQRGLRISLRHFLTFSRASNSIPNIEWKMQMVSLTITRSQSHEVKFTVSMCSPLLINWLDANYLIWKKDSGIWCEERASWRAEHPPDSCYAASLVVGPAPVPSWFLPLDEVEIQGKKIHIHFIFTRTSTPRPFGYTTTEYNFVEAAITILNKCRHLVYWVSNKSIFEGKFYLRTITQNGSSSRRIP